MQDRENATQTFDASALLRGAGVASNAAQLVVLGGTNLGERVVLHRARTGIGRRETSDFVLDSHTVSRNHACVVREADRYYIVDVGSANGVYLNGRKIPASQKCHLSHGDNLLLGEVLVLFQNPQRFVSAEGLSNIVIDRNKVQREVDEFFARLPALCRAGDERSDLP